MKITLNKFIEELNKLPEEVKAKEIAWIDVSYFDEQELASGIEQLQESKETTIQLCL